MINEPKEKYSYFLYARKSSENEDRQVQSIDDQINRLTELAGNLNIEIKEVYIEAKSAKKPYNRPVFSEMLARIEKGDADGILCWQINRLSRNPIDSGSISWMLQQSILKSIQTIDRQYLPDDNVLLFNVESGMANQYIIDLRKNSSRGMIGKAERGWLPSLAPLGYVNNQSEHNIILDPERFDMIRKMWDMMLTGNFTPGRIRTIANKNWGFRTPKRKKYGDVEMSNSVIYKMFGNIFYTGMFQWSGKLYQGNHQPMITLEEYDRVQFLLGKKGKPRAKTHSFAFTGMIHCAECGCMYTATEKNKFIKTTGQFKTYVYYHCTKKKKEIDCINSRPVTLEKIEAQIEAEIFKYTIMPEFLAWGLEALNIEREKETGDKTKIHTQQQTSLREAEKELGNLTRMRYKELIDDETFVQERNDLKNTITKLTHQLSATTDHSEKYIELTERTLHFATYARRSFAKGTLDEKREILLTLGSNCAVKEKKLFIEAFEWLTIIEKQYPPLQEEFTQLELNKTLAPQERNEILLSIRTRWGAYWESNPDRRFHKPQC